MKKIAIALCVFTLTFATTSCKEKQVEASLDEMSEDVDNTIDDITKIESKTITVAMGSKSGSAVSGTIALTQGEKEVTMVVNLSGLTAGDHAIHVHENGDCSSDDGKSAGGHWNPKAEDHGKWGDEMHHAGDIGNLVADADGKTTLTFSTDQWCLGCDDASKNLVGKSFIVHAKADDFKTQPTGDAGGRVACGVIKE